MVGAAAVDRHQRRRGVDRSHAAVYHILRLHSRLVCRASRHRLLKKKYATRFHAPIRAPQLEQTSRVNGAETTSLSDGDPPTPEEVVDMAEYLGVVVKKAGWSPLSIHVHTLVVLYVTQGGVDRGNRGKTVFR